MPIVVLLNDRHLPQCRIIPRTELIEIDLTCDGFTAFIAAVPILRLCPSGVEAFEPTSSPVESNAKTQSCKDAKQKGKDGKMVIQKDSFWSFLSSSLPLRPCTLAF
jgi:hypothetical protein